MFLKYIYAIYMGFKHLAVHLLLQSARMQSKTDFKARYLREKLANNKKKGCEPAEARNVGTRVFSLTSSVL